MNNLELSVALVTDPKRAMGEIGERPRFWFPLLVPLVALIAVLLWFFNVVDIDWLADKTIRSNPGMKNMPDEQLAQTIRIMAGGGLMWTTLILLTLGSVIGLLLQSLWFLLAGKVTNVQRSFKQWFSLTAWTSLPGVLALLAAIPVLLTAKSLQMDIPSAISPLSLNELFFHRSMGDPGYQLLTNINPIQIFTVFLLVLGVKLWSGRSWVFALLFTLLPALVIGGVAALLALR